MEPSQYEPGLPDALQPREHLLDFTLQSATLRFVLGVPARWNLELELPFRETQIAARFLDAEGAELPDFESIHHRTETISGLGDVVLWGRRPLPALGDWALDLRFGVSAPTGNTEDDPFALGEQGLEHQHVFFGNGTWDAHTALAARRKLGSWSIVSWLRTRVPTGRSSEGFRAGASGTLGSQLVRPLGGDWSLLFNLQADHQESASWNDRDARNSGRTDLVLGAGLGRNVADTWSVQVLALVPENLSARGGQIDPQPVLTIGIAKVFVGDG